MRAHGGVCVPYGMLVERLVASSESAACWNGDTDHIVATAFTKLSKLGLALALLELDHLIAVLPDEGVMREHDDGLVSKPVLEVPHDGSGSSFV